MGIYVIIGIPIIGLLFALGIHGSNSLEKLRLHWNEYRCSPAYIPFAGYIRPDISVNENFMFCIGSMANEIFKPILDVINSMFADVHSSLGELTAPLNLFRQLFSRIRNFMLGFMSSTFGKITSSTGIFTFYLIKIRDVLTRFAGHGYIAAFLARVGIQFIESFVFLVIGIIKTFVYAMLAISIILALFNPELLVLMVVIASLIGASGF
jgi:hypothetical protein